MLIWASNMKALRAFLHRLAGIFHKEERDRRLAEELESHLRMQVDDNIRSGMTPEDARRDALIRSGGLEPAKEAYRDRRGLPLLETLVHDFRFAVRMIRKSPGFTAVVVLTLALGIGANTAIFSVVHAALTPLAIPAPDRAVMVWTENAKRNWHEFPVSVPDYLDWKASGVFSSLAAFHEDGFNLRSGDRTERIAGLKVTAEYFDVLSTKPQLGRLFRQEDMQNQVVILSDALWRSHFAGDPDIAGKSIVIEGIPHTVVGVLPARFPSLAHEDLYAPLVFSTTAAANRGSRSFPVIGRLRPGIGMAAAQQRMTEVSLELARQYTTNKDVTALLQPLAEAYVQDAKALLAILFGAVGLVLLITCANIANLLLARGTSRGKEMAIRAALGGSRWRLSRQLLAENLLLACLGGALAVLPCLWGIHFIASYRLEALPNPDLVTLNSTVLAFNFVLSLVTGVLFGLVPAWQIRKADVHDALKSSARSHSGGGFHQRLRGVFVVSEVALTLVLLVGAGLIWQSFLRMRSADPGYRSHGVLTMKIALSDRQYEAPEKQLAFYQQVIERARALPGVVAAGATDELPTSDSFHGTGLYTPEHPDPRPEDVTFVLNTSVTADYFRVMHMPLLRGRYLSESDRTSAPLVGVVDEWTARHYWPGQDVVGRRFKFGAKGPWREVVGVVGVVEQPVLTKVIKGQAGQVYVPLGQQPVPAMSVVLRTEGDPALLIPAMRNAVRGIDVDQPVFAVQTMDEARAAGRASQLLATWLMGGFALIALLLAAIGVYGLVAYNVGQRTREFGIRMSLGAKPRDVLGLVVRQSIVLTAAGMVTGLAAAFALTRLMGALLYGVRATDPLTFAGVTGLLACVALLASYIPARRAARVDPVTALRCE